MATVQTKILVHKDDEKHEITVNLDDVQQWLSKGFVGKGTKPRGRKPEEVKPEVKTGK